MHKNLQHVLTSDELPWCDELAQILAHFNRKHAIKDKDVSHKTRQDREDFYFAFFRELRSNEEQKMKVRPRNLADRQIRFMVRRWVHRGLEPGTIQLYLRTFAPSPSGSAIRAWCNRRRTMSTIPLWSRAPTRR